MSPPDSHAFVLVTKPFVILIQHLRHFEYFLLNKNMQLAVDLIVYDK
jgi:hypothetical protein